MPNSSHRKASISEAIKETKKIINTKGNDQGNGSGQTKLQKALDKEVTNYRFSLLKYKYLEDGKINARGRIYIKLLVLLLSLMYVTTDSNFIEVLTYISLMSVLLPFIINLTTEVIVKKQNINESNLYDMIYGLGIYVITLIPSVAVITYLMKKIKIAMPDIYNTFSGFPMLICIMAAVFILVDIILFAKSDKNR